MARKSTEVLAVELGERTIKVFQGPSRRKSMSVNRVLLVDTPAGSVEQYVITDWEKLKDAFKHEIFTRTKSRKIMFVLDHAEVIKRRLTLNLVDDEDLPGLVRYRLGEYLGFDMDDYIVQFSKIEESKDARGMPILDIFVSAIPKYIVESYVGLCGELSIEPYVLDTKTNVLQSMIHQGVTINGEINLGKSKTICFIEMGQEQIEVNIFADASFQYNHIVPQGIQSVFRALDDKYQLGADVIERFIMSRSIEHWGQAQQVVQSSLVAGQSSSPTKPKDTINIMRSYHSELAQWIDGIHRVLLLYGGRQEKINQILVYGDAFAYPGIKDMLRQQVSPDIQLIESISSLVVPKKLERLGSELYRYINLVGLMSK